MLKSANCKPDWALLKWQAGHDKPACVRHHASTLRYKKSASKPSQCALPFTCEVDNSCLHGLYRNLRVDPLAAGAERLSYGVACNVTQMSARTQRTRAHRAHTQRTRSRTLSKQAQRHDDERKQNIRTARKDQQTHTEREKKLDR
jgi:hypothetical protein